MLSTIFYFVIYGKSTIRFYELILFIKTLQKFFTNNKNKLLNISIKILKSFVNKWHLFTNLHTFIYQIYISIKENETILSSSNDSRHIISFMFLFSKYAYQHAFLFLVKNFYHKYVLKHIKYLFHIIDIVMFFIFNLIIGTL